MALRKPAERQDLIVATVDFTFADIATTAVAVAAMDLPPNAIVAGGDIVVTTVWNTGTSAALAVGDVTTTNRYASAVDLKALGRTALTLTGFTVTSTQKLLSLLPTYVGGAATAGVARLTLHYYIKARGTHPAG